MIAYAVAALLIGPSLKYRWVYVQTNLFRPEAVKSTVALIHRAAKVGYNGILYADTKLQNQNPYPDFYRKAVQTVLMAAQEEHMEVIPCVLPVGYAAPMLFLDPSLVESMPCRHVAFQAVGGVLKSDPTELYEDGGFERATRDAIKGVVFQDAAGKTSFLDSSVVHSGRQSLRIQDPVNNTETHGNCRIVRRVKLKPWHQYRLTAWMKSKEFDQAGSVRALALTDKGKTLSFQDLAVQSTQDWKLESVVFNSQDNDQALIYLGIWGGNKGTLWFDDVSLQDAGLLNVDRRAACPVAVTSSTGEALSEVRDFETVADPSFGNVPWLGEFDMAQEIPAPHLVSGSRIHEGDTVYLDYYAAASTDIGKTSICLADPATAKLERNEISRVEELMHPTGMMLCQDEMRVQGWCGACERSGKTPGRLIADDIRRSSAMVGSKQVFVWSDMFDPFHNAVDDYYLCHGSVKGSWEGLRPGTIVLNWNSGHPKESLSFFAGRGFHQILAGYYDADPAAIKPWMEIARQVGGLDGVMYTTWQGKYDDIEAFAKAAWGGTKLP